MTFGACGGVHLTDIPPRLNPRQLALIRIESQEVLLEEIPILTTYDCLVHKQETGLYL